MDETVREPAEMGAYGESAALKANEMGSSGLFTVAYQVPGGFLLMRVA